MRSHQILSTRTSSYQTNLTQASKSNFLNSGKVFVGWWKRLFLTTWESHELEDLSLWFCLDGLNQDQSFTGNRSRSTIKFDLHLQSFQSPWQKEDRCQNLSKFRPLRHSLNKLLRQILSSEIQFRHVIPIPARRPGHLMKIIRFLGPFKLDFLPALEFRVSVTLLF